MKRRKPKFRYRIGPGGVAYLMVMGLILAAAIYTQANLLFWAFGLTIGGLLMSLVMAWVTLRGIGVQRLLPAHGVAGDGLVIRYHLTNRSWLPAFSLILRENWGSGSRGWRRQGPVASGRDQMLLARPSGWVLHIGPHQTLQAEAPCWPQRRGPLKFERIEITTSFPFNVIRKIAVFEQAMEVLIYPSLHRMNRRVLYTLSQADPAGRKHIERRGGQDEFYGLREYRPGDSLKLIDWKRTAHAGKLIAREHTQPSPPRIMVLLDLSDTQVAARMPEANGEMPEDLQRRLEENAISLTASLICDAYLHGYQIGLAVKGVVATAFPVHHSLPHRTRMLETLGCLDLDVPRRDHQSGGAMAPSVIIWPGYGSPQRRRTSGTTRATVLGAAEIEKYVSETGAARMLGRLARPSSKRQDQSLDAAVEPVDG